MSITVTQIRRDYDRRHNSPMLKVYVSDTPLHAMANHWFSDNNLYNLKVKSKAWSAITRYIARVIGTKIADHFGAKHENCKFNHKCGCSCGCSPGYNVHIANGEYFYKDAWVKVDVSDSEIEGLKELISSEKFNILFHKDKINHEKLQ